MSKISRVGVDLAKNVIQVHVVDARGEKAVGGRAGQGETNSTEELPGICPSWILN